jgi:hypothetical protein
LPDGPDLGERLLRIVAENGADAEQELRRAALDYADAVRAAERKNSRHAGVRSARREHRRRHSPE